MQNDEVFEAEATVEALERAALLSRRADGHGNLATTAARGGVYPHDSSSDDEFEDAPLIPRKQRTESILDPEGLPWWRRPSVRKCLCC